ncbi:VCBS repeat-containing protein [Cerasicoccus frondis]|uniref:VCBS repeat-containing protein n=1 Tax=Cerasicoccus frondis TaxID=490090 RepID=UPI0028525FFE|nr:VCBS repeat-containing protein [Cerasicoccus frondis]
MKLHCFILFGAISALQASDFEMIWEQPLAGTSRQDAAMGDIDGDGDVDVLLCGLDSDTAILLNDGSGNLSLGANPDAIPQGKSVALADLDDDGDLDIFLACLNEPCQVWLNDGAGVFTDSGQSIGLDQQWSALAMVDVDDDDDLDAVVTGSTVLTADASRIFLNDGDGVFTESAHTLGSASTSDVAVGDVDGDGDVDILLANIGSSKLMLNDGSGVFTASSQSFGVSSTHGVAMADLDGDDDLDIFFANGSVNFTYTNTVWLNDGEGVFTDSGQSLGTDYTLSVVLSDVDDDGDLDAIEGNNIGEISRLLYNDGSGNFTDSGLGLGHTRISGLAAGNLNGDSNPDVFFVGNLGPSKVWFGSSSTGLIDSGELIGGAAGSSAAAADIDDDGDIDIALGCSGGITWILLNDGAGQFSFYGEGLANGSGNNNGALAFGDFDNDGDEDLVVTNSEHSASTDYQTRLWFNDGSGNFTLEATLFADSPTESVAVADLDGDDDLDIVCGSQAYGVYAGQNHIFFNDGSGNFSRVDTLGSSYTTAIIVEDFDGDDDPDIFLTITNAGNQLWLNDGDGNFTNSGQSLGSNRTFAADAADVDDDGDLDVVCGNLNQSNVLWLNDGSGIFSQSAASLGNGGTRAVRFIDKNGDGAPDIWIGNGPQEPEADWIYVNDGSGAYSLDQTIEARAVPALVAADFDDDGLDDIFQVSGKGNSAVWSRLVSISDIEAYAASFGLSGSDLLPMADPDGDGLPNIGELAFNLNPGVHDAAALSDTGADSSGLPVSGTFMSPIGGQEYTAVVIQREDTASLEYRLMISYDLDSFTEAEITPLSTSSVDENYARYTYILPREDGQVFWYMAVEYNQ